MINEEDLKKVKELAETFLSTMTVEGFEVAVRQSADMVDVEITLPEPQVLIGEDGKTLLDIQRLLRMVVNKNFGGALQVRVDINGYKAKKIEQLEKMATELADQVSLTKISKTLPPMSSYERRIIHAALAERDDVITQSQGEGLGRHLVINAK